MGHIPNINAISDALIILNLSILIPNSQCEVGARDGIDIWYMGIILRHVKPESLDSVLRYSKI